MTPKPPSGVSTGTAPGKVILFGEHAVVYGRPAIAVPVTEVQARARVEPGPTGRGVRIVAPDVGREVWVSQAAAEDPLAHIVRLTYEAMLPPARRREAAASPTKGQALRHLVPDWDLTITVSSTVPMARGMGSGAALSTAVVRALAQHFSYWLPSQAVSDLVYETEVLYHGTPSGIDNTVIAFEKPVYFVKGADREIFWVSRPFWLAIADTGVQSSTRAVVGDVRRRYEADPARFEALFDEVGATAAAARSAIEQGAVEEMGRLMDRNHALLQQMGVSSPELDRLVVAAQEGGALGAKLSGAGWGGNVIVLVPEEARGHVDLALRLGGAAHVILTRVQ